ncbi:hypothetical protein QRO11_09325 [Paracidovorax citrulli]|uniref:Uncharacterized protein n=2 Tax=Paracidovorax citrulli TaxID=80869 RepID=A1TPI8_PARC0|nr:hypothetical protein [Paracidovorax citrulli]ABM32876.1 conserved hypothetical protein [Paracidovorax citrulli AAC00-1]ATG93150.1 hypothetical protein CQB05_03075 [Paracidovorax citrulli]MVT29100.1 hypothetical protein [Paracidovorax citrulli]PVY67092.1 hypothetical protein C8E08_4523 [Paracidovorax citrulli]QCX12936.1 hypothetical protein APS58_4240 [Paracidovorax citrulli]
MSGISPLGWLHTLGSLPAIPAAVYMFARSGRIVPRSRPGLLYLVCMLIGASTVFLVTRQAAGYAVGALTLFFLAIGYGVGHVRALKRASIYIGTIALTLTVFLLMVPTATETLRRFPPGDPVVSSLQSPLLRGVHIALLASLVVGLTVQILRLRRRNGSPGQSDLL